MVLFAPMKPSIASSCVDLLEYRFLDAQIPLVPSALLLTPKRKEEFALLVLSTLNLLTRDA